MNLDDYELLREHKDTLRNLSYDSANKEYMTNSSDMAVDFDTVKRNYCNGKGMSEEVASSVDALYQHGDEFSFVEFKNGELSGKKNEIKEKADESAMIFCDITGLHISDTRRSLSFVLVYNEDKVSARQEKAKAMAKLSKDNWMVLPGLDKHEGLCFRKIVSYDREEFETWLLSAGARSDDIVGPTDEPRE